MSGAEFLLAANAVPTAATAANATLAGAALGSGLTVPAAALAGEFVAGAPLIPALSAPVSTGLQAIASTAPGASAPMFANAIPAAAQAAGITLGSGLVPQAGATLGTATQAVSPMQALNMARSGLQLTQSGGQRTAYSPPQMNRGRQVTLAEPIQSLLETQPMRRRKDMLSLI